MVGTSNKSLPGATFRNVSGLASNQARGPLRSCNQPIPRPVPKGGDALEPSEKLMFGEKRQLQREKPPVMFVG